MGTIGMKVQDKLLTVTKALPTGASAVSTSGIDLGNTSRGSFLAEMELQIDAPVLVVGKLANGSTMTYDIEHDDDSAFGTVAKLVTAAIVQTGAGGVGAAAAVYRFTPPTNVKRYMRVTVTNSAAADASASSVTVTPCF